MAFEKSSTVQKYRTHETDTGSTRVQVAVLNLLPIPILDGGQILINVLESAKGSPFSLRTREYILRFGLVAIALLFAIVMYNDTQAGIAKLFGWVGKLVQ